MIGGQVGIAGHINIGDRVQIGSKSGISNNVPDGSDDDGLSGHAGNGVPPFECGVPQPARLAEAHHRTRKESKGAV